MHFAFISFVGCKHFTKGIRRNVLSKTLNLRSNVGSKIIIYTHPFVANKTQKMVSAFTFQKGTSDTSRAAPVTQSVASELSPTAIMYSLLYFKSTQRFQIFSYVTWAYPDISSAITQYLNLGNILRRSPLHPMVTFAFFWEQSTAFNRGCPCVVFSFQMTTKTHEGRSEYTMWRDLKGVFMTVAESTTLPENSWPTHCYSFEKTKYRAFTWCHVSSSIKVYCFQKHHDNVTFEWHI